MHGCRPNEDSKASEILQWISVLPAISSINLYNQQLVAYIRSDNGRLYVCVRVCVALISRQRCNAIVHPIPKSSRECKVRHRRLHLFHYQSVSSVQISWFHALVLSRDFSDVPISSILGNNHLQCKQCAYRPSYRCQQLRGNYIKYNYTFLRQPVLYAYTCYNRWAIYYFTILSFSPTTNVWLFQNTEVDACSKMRWCSVLQLHIQTIEDRIRERRMKQHLDRLKAIRERQNVIPGPCEAKRVMKIIEQERLQAHQRRLVV